MFTKIKWHDLTQNPEDRPKRTGDDFLCITETGYLHVLSYYDGFNCSPNSKEHEIRVFMWADLKNTRSRLLTGNVLAAVQEAMA